MAIVNIGSYDPYGYEALAVNTAMSLTASKYTSAGAKSIRAIISVETAQIRYTLDGTTPEATVGHLLNPGDILILENSDQITSFKAVKVSSAGAIKVTYFKR